MSTEYDYVPVVNTSELRVGDYVSKSETDVTHAVVRRVVLSPQDEAEVLIENFMSGGSPYRSPDALAKAILDLVG